MRVYRVKKMGRPSIGWEKDKTVSEDNIVTHPRRLVTKGDTSLPEICSPTSSLSSKADPKRMTGTSSRKRYFLLEKTESSFKNSKLPKSRTVLRNFLYQLEEKGLDKPSAAQETLKSVKEVWQHHFGMRVVLGFDSDLPNLFYCLPCFDLHSCKRSESLLSHVI